MLENETDTILRVLSERTIGSKDALSLDEILTADVPQGIKTYFKAEVVQGLEDDLARSPKFSRLRQSPGATRMLQAFVRSLAGTWTFTREEFLTTLDHSVHFNENFLCRPQWTLEQFLFNDSPRVTREALARAFSFASDYSYYGEIILRTLLSREQEEISREEFRDLTGRIDDSVVRQHNARELAALTKPIFRFFQAGGLTANGEIPLQAILLFFDDKNMRLLKEYIQGICHLRNRTHITFEELSSLIGDLYAGRQNITPAADPPKPMNEPAPAAPLVLDPLPAAAETAALPEVAAAAPAEPAKEIPAELPRAQLPQAEERKPAIPPEKANIALSLTFAGLRESSTAPRQIPDLNTLIPEEAREQYTKDIFNSDPASYALVLSNLNAIRTWREASLFLDDLYRKSGLNPIAEEVVRFTETIHQRYETEEGTFW